MALLDTKIAYILTKESDINNAIYTRFYTKLQIDGEAVTRYMSVIKMILDLFKTDILGYNLKLELYKKLLHLLRSFGLIFRIPDLSTTDDNPILYWGAGDPGLNVANLQMLTTSQLEFTTQLSFTYTLTEQVYYFCYPQSIGDGTLDSILDNNGFETLPGWTLRTESFVFAGVANITYNVYEFNNITTQTSFTNTFIL